MATLQKIDTGAELKMEPAKPQREPKKAVPEKVTNTKANPSPEKKEVKDSSAVKKEPQTKPNSAEQTKPIANEKSPDKKEVKDAVKKEPVSKPNFAEQNNKPATNVNKSPEKNEAKPEKKESSPNKASNQVASESKPTTPDKVTSKKPSVEKTVAGQPLPGTSKNNVPLGSIIAKAKTEPSNGTLASKDKAVDNKPLNNTTGSSATTEKLDKTKSSEVTNTNDKKNETKPSNDNKVEEDSKEDSQKNQPNPEQKADEVQDTSSKEKSKEASNESASDLNPVEKINKKSENETNQNESDKTELNKEGKKQKKITSKKQLRSEIWNKMFRSSMLAVRKPCVYRIPHFKGDIISAGRLTTLNVFQDAKVVKLSLDKAQECVRLQVIEAGKEMIVGFPGLREAVFLHVKPPMEPSKSSNKLASSRIGICHIGTALDFSAGKQADLVIVGSVAVDKTGLRIGKGEGFADLEYALLKKLGGIAPNAPIITVVHDSQVYDSLPEELFKEHDVPADYIVTPTQVIEVNPKRKHPELKWDILSNRRVNSIPIIKQLLDKEKNRDGANISLKDEDTDSEELDKIAQRKRYFSRRRTYSNGNQRGRGQLIQRNTIQNNPGKRIRRQTAPSVMGYNNQHMFSGSPRQGFRNNFWVAGQFRNGGRLMNNFRPIMRPKWVDFSLKVEGLNNSVRVRDLKSAVTQRGIRPRDITWLPHKGVAFLHFSKLKKQMEQTPKVQPDTDSILATLKDLTIKSENGPETNLIIEPAQPFRKVRFTV